MRIKHEDTKARRATCHTAQHGVLGLFYLFFLGNQQPSCAIERVALRVFVKL